MADGPIFRTSFGFASCSVYANQNDGRWFLSYNLQTRYKQGETWKYTNNLNHRDMPAALMALQQAGLKGASWLEAKNANRSQASTSSTSQNQSTTQSTTPERQKTSSQGASNTATGTPPDSQQRLNDEVPF